MKLPAGARAPILLLGAMLLASVVVAGFTLQLLSVQGTVLEDTIRDAQVQALELLGSRVEHTLLGALRPAFLPLKNIPVDAVDEPRLALVRKAFPEVQGILLLDRRMHLKRVFPRRESAHDAVLDEWLARRVSPIVTEGKVKAFALHTFDQELPSGPALFAIQPVNDVDPEAGWILIRFNLKSLEREQIAPLLRAFADTEGGRIQLQDPEAEWDEAALHAPLTHVLPGWLLSYRPDTARDRGTLDRNRLLLLGVAGGAVLALLLATYGAWLELRRDRSLVELRNRFVANVSHELKTPLALIRMYAETLYLGRISEEERRQSYYETILRESERLTEIINTVLDLERLRRGVGLYQLTHGDLGATVAGVLERYGETLKERGVGIDVQIEAGLPAVAHDPNGVTQILLNLLNNAAEHGGREGIELRLGRDGDWVDLSVTDHGPGISGEQRAEIRKALHRGENARSGRGSGLGLALVEQIAAAHNAYLVLEAPAQGTGLRVVVSFPVPRRTTRP